ncbi:MAG: peptidoglycan-associated lipoprotein [Pseudomonadales bacterium]|nr:MAG: peptidoglycan-associated lipoprotein [Pseudomonadales bacterium]
MSILNKKVAMIALASAVLAVTGCSSKTNRSQVAVSPLGMSGSGAYGSAGYDGGAIIGNGSNGALASEASGLQSTVYFAFDSSDITSQASAILNQHAALLGKNQGSSVVVTGHTDPRGSREYNMALGERRANAVKSYLSSNGVDVNNIEVISRGEEESTGTNEASYAQDRRAVLAY